MTTSEVLTHALDNTPDQRVEYLAAGLCEERWGAGSWKKGGINRSYWRRQARQLLDTLARDLTEHK